VEISSLSRAELRAHYTLSDGFFKGKYLYTDSMYIKITSLLIFHESQKNSRIDAGTKIECTIRKLLALTSRGAFIFCDNLLFRVFIYYLVFLADTVHKRLKLSSTRALLVSRFVSTVVLDKPNLSLLVNQCST
jgi:hypothetical protein